MVSSLLFLTSSAVKEKLTSERRAESSLVILVLISAVSLLKMFSISGVLFFVSRSLTILVTRAESSSEIFCLRIIYMAMILINITEITNEKIADKAKNGMLLKKLNNIKLDMI